MTPEETMRHVDSLMAHVWMVRTFLKHHEEAAEEDELQDVQRALYDVMHALGPPLAKADAAAYLKQARKKFAKLRAAAERFAEIQPEVSAHTDFQMAVASLRAAAAEIARVLEIER